MLCSLCVKSMNCGGAGASCRYCRLYTLVVVGMFFHGHEYCRNEPVLHILRGDAFHCHPIPLPFDFEMSNSRVHSRSLAYEHCKRGRSVRCVVRCGKIKKITELKLFNRNLKETKDTEIIDEAQVIMLVLYRYLCDDYVLPRMYSHNKQRSGKGESKKVPLNLLEAHPTH